MKQVLTPEESRQTDRALIEDYGIPGLTLMERAAEGVARAVRRQVRPPERTLVLCGTGNNGGDGLAVLRLLHEAGYPADGFLYGSPETLRGDAKTNYTRALACGCHLLEEAPQFDAYRCVVDALFGTGLSRDLSPQLCELIGALNRSGAYTVAVDIPSGVDGLTGRRCGAAVEADETVTFQYLKRGLLLFPGRSCAGRVSVHPIAEPHPAASAVCWLEEGDVAALLPARPLDSHKGNNGRALLCVGSARYTGAALLSARAALRGGAGLLTVAVPAAVKPAFAQVPEAMCAPCGDGTDWDVQAQAAAARLLPGATAVGIGSGMGEMADAALLGAVLRSGLPAVIDADALNLLARRQDMFALLHANCVLTPHPAEMARLMQCETAAVLADPIGIAREMAARWRCTVLLKGATTCISDGERVLLNTSGNPGLAKGGSGDVLTGLLLALLAQRLLPIDAACAAAYLLGASADRAYALLGNRMLVAGDVIDAIREEIRAERAR